MRGDLIVTVHEKIEALKRQKTGHTTEELDRLGWRRYSELQGELELQHHGDYVMIEVDSGDRFVGKSPKRRESLPKRLIPVRHSA